MIDFTEDVFTLVIDDANIEENVAILRFIDAMGFQCCLRELLNDQKILTCGGMDYTLLYFQNDLFDSNIQKIFWQIFPSVSK